ncbi:MAG: metallophosphoesterase family protein, partial [Candidatus Heimdallarchaeota archaeon]
MTNITLLHLSDIHAQNNLNLEPISALIERESIELIVISGDITQFGTKDDVQRILALFNQLSAVVFYVTGNLDPPNSFTFTSKNVKPLEGQLEEFKGVQFVGLSGSNKTPFRTPYELTEEEIQMKLQHLKTLLDTSKPFILVSHVPPFNSG